MTIQQEEATALATPDTTTWQAPAAEALSPWQRGMIALRDAYRILTLSGAERRYQQRVLSRLARGEKLGTLGNNIQDEATTRERGDQWLAHLIQLGLKPEHLCVEYGCGSLWCAEPIIHYMQPGRFVALDVTDAFYAYARPLLGSGMPRAHRIRAPRVPALLG